MRHETKGEVRQNSDGSFSSVIRYGKRVTFPLPTCTTRPEAEERSTLLATIAKRFRSAGTNERQGKTALDIVAAASARSLRNAVQSCEELLGGAIPLKGGPEAPTFQTLGERWTSGELARQHPDQIKAKRSAPDDIRRLTRYVYPKIGSTPIDRLTLDDCERVMRDLPPHLSVATRRNVGQLVTRLLRMAVYPLRYIDRTPVPVGFLPTAKQVKALAYLYPDEDARLMACRAVPVCFRLLWGFLAREGMREGEALSLTWSALSLERGAVRLDRNKTDDPRAWALAPGTADALRAYRDSLDDEPEADDLVFTDEHGGSLSKFGLADTLRSHLAAVGLKAERPELFTTTAERRRIRVHDLRGTFVTVSLANGKSEAWISDRTGHRSSQMINRYKRTARTFEELRGGELAPLCEAIPELAHCHSNAIQVANRARNAASPTGFEPVLQP